MKTDKTTYVLIGIVATLLVVSVAQTFAIIGMEAPATTAATSMVGGC